MGHGTTDRANSKSKSNSKSNSKSKTMTTEEDAVAFVVQMLCALDVMENAEFVHGDLG